MQWWQNLALRERLILAAAALLVSFVLLDTLVLQPFQLSRQQLEQDIAQARDDLDWMRSAVNRLPSPGASKQKIHAGRVITFLDQQISRQGLKKNMQQMTPIQDHSARLRLSDVEFSKLLQFFSAISGSILVEEVRILPADQPGLVNVSLVVNNGQGG
jgi:type II secretory pathway component PulM